MALKDPYGLQGSFLDKQLLTTDFDKEIENLHKEANALESKPSLTEYGKTPMPQSWKFANDRDLTPGGGTTPGALYPAESQTEREEEERYLRKQELKCRNMFGTSSRGNRERS